MKKNFKITSAKDKLKNNQNKQHQQNPSKTELLQVPQTNNKLQLDTSGIDEEESQDLNIKSQQNETDRLAKESAQNFNQSKQLLLKNDPKLQKMQQELEKAKQGQKKLKQQFPLASSKNQQKNPVDSNSLSTNGGKRNSNDIIQEEEFTDSVKSHQGMNDKNNQIEMLKQKRQKEFKPLKPCKNEAKKYNIEIVSLQGVNLCDTIKCKIELVDVDNFVVQHNDEQCHKIKQLQIRKETKKLMQFEHLLTFPINENIINELKVVKPRLQITLYMEQSNEVIGFIDMQAVDPKTNKLKKGHFIKRLYKYDKNLSDFENQMQTPFRLGILLYRDVPFKWAPMIDKPYLTDFDSGFLFTAQSIQFEKKKWYQKAQDEKIQLALEFALLNNGKVQKDHNLDSIIYTTQGFNKYNPLDLRVNFEYQQRMFMNWEMFFDINRNNLHKIFIIITVYKKISAYGSEREEYGWYIHPLFRVREYNSGQFSVNMFKPPMENKIKYNLDDYEKIPDCKLNFNFLGFQEHQNNSYMKEKKENNENNEMKVLDLDQNHSGLLSPQNIESEQQQFGEQQRQSQNSENFININNQMNTSTQSRQRKKFLSQQQVQNKGQQQSKQQMNQQDIENQQQVIKEEQYEDNEMYGQSDHSSSYVP